MIAERPPPHGVMFHHIRSDSSENAPGTISQTEFRQALLRIGIQNILPAKEWFDKATTNRLAADDVCLTFDDALQCQVEYALPVLEELGLTGFWFIYSTACNGNGAPFEVYSAFVRENFEQFEEFFSLFCLELENEFPRYRIEESIGKCLEERYLSDYSFYSAKERQYRYLRDQFLGPELYSNAMDALMQKSGVKRETLSARLWLTEDTLLDLAKKSHMIGLHSYSHPTNFKALSVDNQKIEYQDNFDHIKKITGKNPESMAHPVNSYNDRTLTILRHLGIKLGFRSNLHLRHHSELEFPRQDAADLV